MKKKKIDNSSRTENVIKNSSFGAVGKVLSLILDFICRTVFIKCLTEEYLGLNGLFSNILTILSFAELGIGEAIVFNMYKPIEKKDHDKINQLMRFYKKCYLVIGIIIFIIGVSVIPFLKYIIKEVPDIKESISLIYLLYLTNSSLTYFFASRKSIISAHQQRYIISKYEIFYTFIFTILKIIALLCFKNYILYLVLQILKELSINITVHIKAKKMYSYLDEKNSESLPKEESKTIFTNVKSLFLYKLSSVVLSGTDNIIISKFIGLVQVGIVSNYQLLTSAISQVLHNFILGFTASIGNLNAKSDKEHEEKVFYEILQIMAWIYGYVAIMLVIFLNPFVECWIGKEYLLSLPIVFALVFDIYINGVQYSGYNYVTTLGLFKKAKYGPLFAAIINIVLSIALMPKFGLFGIFIATIISRVLTTSWLDPYLVHKYEFKTSFFKYIKKYLYYLIVVIINLLVCYNIFKLINMNNIINIILYAILCTILSNIIFVLFFFKTKEFNNLKDRFKVLILKYKK